jgi:ribosome assembly protein YihI (activator of Der GTPase)
MSDKIRREPPERLVKAAMDVLSSTKTLVDNAAARPAKVEQPTAEDTAKAAKRTEANRKKRERQKAKKREEKAAAAAMQEVKQQQQQQQEQKEQQQPEVAEASPKEIAILTDVIGLPLQHQLAQLLKVTPQSVAGKIDKASQVVALVSSDQTHILAFGRTVELDLETTLVLDVVGPVELQKQIVTELKKQQENRKFLEFDCSVEIKAL